MDIFTHAIVGAVTGHAFGYPVTGLVAGIAPDLVLGIKRRALPIVAYNVTHSFFWALVLGGALYALWGIEVALTGLFATLSHLYLDWLTHGDQWGPTLAFPFRTRFTAGFGEWEFFDTVWQMGLVAALGWCVLFATIGAFL